MREMVLNHVSLSTVEWHDALKFLPDLADGMASLVRGGAAQSTLRMSRSLHENYWPGQRSLFDAFRQIRREGARDQSLFLMKLSEKAPLLSDLGPHVTDRFPMCGARTLPPDEGAPLVLCVITDAIAVSFPSEPAWDRDRLAVEFEELLPDGKMEKACEDIDNLARSAHASLIVDRNVGRLRRRCADATDLWGRRRQMFPHLAFGQDVGDHLVRVNAGWLSTLVNRLGDLDDAAAAWADAGGDAPPWTCKVTPESTSVMNNERLREARRFKSVNGEPMLFAWHARFGRGARIHLRFDARTRQIEIGYIGVHLPT